MAETADHQDLPYLYRSDELSREARRGFEGHLNSCAECRAALKRLDWAEGLARAAAVVPEPALVERALLRALGARAVRWRWSDWTQPAGMGFGLAFAVGLFLFRASHPAARAPSARGGLAVEISELDGRLDRLDTELSLEAWTVEFDDGLDELSRSRQGLQSQLAQQEGV